jgi:hypothetical protein
VQRFDALSDELSENSSMSLGDLQRMSPIAEYGGCAAAMPPREQPKGED